MTVKIHNQLRAIEKILNGRLKPLRVEYDETGGVGVLGRGKDLERQMDELDETLSFLIGAIRDELAFTDAAHANHQKEAIVEQYGLSWGLINNVKLPVL